MSFCNGYSSIKVLQVSDIIKFYPDILSRLEDVLDLPMECNLSTNAIKCPCSSFLFELNFMYYLYTYNECFLQTGKINDETLTTINQTIIFTIISKKNISNNDVKMNQTINQTSKMININDPENQSTMSSVYYNIYSNLLKAFENENIKINAKKIANIEKGKFLQELQETIKTISIDNSAINVTIKDGIYKQLKGNLNQSTTLKLVSQELGDTMLQSFFASMDIKIPSSCKITKKKTTTTTTTPSSTNYVKGIILIVCVLILAYLIEQYIYHSHYSH